MKPLDELLADMTRRGIHWSASTSWQHDRQWCSVAIHYRGSGPDGIVRRAGRESFEYYLRDALTELEARNDR